LLQSVYTESIRKITATKSIVMLLTPIPIKKGWAIFYCLKGGNKMFKCPYCGSRRVFRYIRDSDWGGGENYYPANSVDDTNIYNESDLDDPAPPDIDICHCRDCDTFFDTTKTAE
jgi:hypothetical protein